MRVRRCFDAAWECVEPGEFVEVGFGFRLRTSPQRQRVPVGFRDITGLDDVATGADREPLDEILEFTHVARPWIGAHAGEDAVVDDAAVAELFPEREKERHQVVDATVAQRRNMQWAYEDAVVEVAPKPASGDLGGKVAVGGGDETEIGLLRLAAADGLVGALLQQAQQFDLHGEGQLTNLVEKQRAALCHRHATFASGMGAGERALHVAEQFGFDERFGDGPTIDGDEGMGVARTGVMDESCKDLLAGTSLARHEHGGIAAGEALRLVDDGLKGRARVKDHHGFSPRPPTLGTCSPCTSNFWIRFWTGMTMVTRRLRGSPGEPGYSGI